MPDDPNDADAHDPSDADFEDHLSEEERAFWASRRPTTDEELAWLNEAERRLTVWRQRMTALGLRVPREPDDSELTNDQLDAINAYLALTDPVTRAADLPEMRARLAAHGFDLPDDTA
jgi:hypothetical protein